MGITTIGISSVLSVACTLSTTGFFWTRLELRYYTMDSLSASMCRTCRVRLLKTSSNSRAFGTTSSRLHIPPESPAFIDIPQPHQPLRDPKPIVKGVLPVPREVFPANRPDKPGPTYLANVTRDPLPKNLPPPAQLTEIGKYKRRMADMRKSHLRESLEELHARKRVIDGQIAHRSAMRQKLNARLVSQAQREDERLTNVSIPSAMRPQRVLKLSAEEELAIYNARKAAHEAKLAAKHEDRLDKLHTLYMNAREFITTREQLATAIDQAFQTTKSIWARQGMPDTIEEIIRRGRDRTSNQGRAGVTLTGDVSERALKDQERMQRIAEKLSGGKM